MIQESSINNRLADTQPSPQPHSNTHTHSHSTAQPNSQADSPHNQLSQSILNVVLVMLESFMTLMLRFDANLRQVVYPLATDNVVVCVRTYVPHLTFYATFSYNGVLLDTELRGDQQVNVTINAFTWQLFQAVFSNKPTVIDILQMRGETQPVQQVKQFLLAIGIGQVVQHLLKLIKGKSSEKSDEEKESQQDKIVRYKQKITDQQAQLHHLTLSHTQLNTQVLELKSKNKTLMIMLGVIAVALIGCIVALVVL